MAQVARWVALTPLLIIPFLALYVSSGLFFPYITGKAFVFRLLVELSFLGWIVLALADKQYRPKFSWTLALYGGLVVWMFFANLLAVNAHKAFWSNFERMDGWVTLVHVFMFFVVAGSLLVKETLRQGWWRAFIAAAALACGVALFQIMGFFTINQGGLRVDATFGNAIYFAVFLMFALGVTLWQAVESKGWLRYLLYVLAAVELGFLLLTASRGALIATFGGAVFAAGWAAWRAGEKGRRMALGVLIALVLLIGGFFLVRNTSFVQNEPVVARLATVFSIGDELNIRFMIWDMALQGAMERPVNGWGQEGFNYVFTKHYNPALFVAEPYYDRAHNTYLDWLIAGGIPAFLLFVGMLISAVLALLRSSIGRGERLVLLSLLVAYGIQALVVFDNLFSYVPLAIILATAHIVSARPIRSVESAPTVPEQGLGMVVVPLMTAVFVATAWIVNAPNIQAAEDIITAQQPAAGGPQQNLAMFSETLALGSFATQEIREHLALFSIRVAQEPTISNELKSQFLTLALTELNTEITRSPLDVRLLLFRASVYRAAGDYENALQSINAALTLSPKKQTILIEKATVLISAGRLDEAYATLADAYELDTRFKDPLIYVAASEILAGRVADGKALLMQEFGTTAINHNVLWNAYANAPLYEDLASLQRIRITESKGAPGQRFLLAQILAVGGQKDAAIAEIQATIAAHPEVAQEGAALIVQITELQ